MKVINKDKFKELLDANMEAYNILDGLENEPLCEIEEKIKRARGILENTSADIEDYEEEIIEDDASDE